MSPEERVGAAVREWLTAQGWTCYAEVQVPAAGKRRADLVAVRGEGDQRLVWVVECKTRLTWQAIAQADAWEGWAHYRSVATGRGPYVKAALTVDRALFAIGITWLRVEDGEVRGCGQNVPQVARKAGLLLDALRPEHRESAPGNARGEYHTAWAENAAHLRRIGAAEPGCALTDALRIVLGKTPDAATRRAWARAIRMGQVPGVRSEREGRRVVLLPDDVTAKGTF